MTTMNNEDPADPSVHEPRELPEPAAWRVYFPDEQREELASSLDELCDDLTNCAHDEPEPLYTADQMREAIAAERGRDVEPLYVRPTPEAVAWALAEEAGEDPGTLIWEGNPPEPWGEVWCRYMPQAESLLKRLFGA